MASEDSDQTVSGVLPVHRLRDPGDLDDALDRRAPAKSHEFHASVRTSRSSAALGSSSDAL